MAKNDITGDEIKSKALSKQGRENYDFIFRKKKEMKRVVLASASWCGPCRGENPNVVAAYKKYKNNTSN